MVSLWYGCGRGVGFRIHDTALSTAVACGMAVVVVWLLYGGGKVISCGLIRLLMGRLWNVGGVDHF